MRATTQNGQTPPAVRPTLRRAGLLVAVSLLLPAALGAQREPRVGGGNAFAWRGEVPNGGWLRVRNLHGEIDVRETSGTSTEVRAERVADPYRIEDAKRIERVTFELRRDGDDVIVCAIVDSSPTCDADEVKPRDSRDDRRNPERVSVTVLLPRGTRVSVLTGQGEVTVTGATADVVARSGNGRVTVAGPTTGASAASGNGAVTVEGARGPVDARSGNGRVRVVTTVGPVVARTGNGDVDVRMDALEGAGDLVFSTGNGRVVALLPANLAADLDASTGHGTVRTDFPVTVSGRLTPERMRGRIGAGGRSVRLSSGNGSIDLRRATR